MINSILLIAFSFGTIIHLVFAEGLSNCDPLDPEMCVLPFPNNFYLRPGADGVKRLSLSSEAFPTDRSGSLIDPVLGTYNQMEGFSPLAPIMTFFGPVNLNNAPRYWSLDTSISLSSPSILLNRETGEIVPHFLELDSASCHLSKTCDDQDLENPNPAKQMLLLWPASRLNDDSRYIVAFTNDLKLLNGSSIQPSEAFLALQKSTPTSNPDIELRRSEFEDIFNALAVSSRKISRDSLILAWEFTTAPSSYNSQKLFFIRDDGFFQVNNQIEYRVDKVKNNVDKNIARQIEISMNLPQYVDSERPGAQLVLNETGYPVFQKMAWIKATITVPTSLVNCPSGNCYANAAFYGHGLFGSQQEILESSVSNTMNMLSAVTISVDWLGMSSQDLLEVTRIISTDLSLLYKIPHRLNQAMFHALAASHLFRQINFLQDAELFLFSNGYQIFANRDYMMNETNIFTLGNSLGGILGTVFMAATKEVKRGALTVPGGPFSMLFPRSELFSPYYDIIKARYPVALDRALVFTFVQLIFDMIDPIFYAPWVVEELASDPNPMSPHEVMILHGLGDAQVTYVGAYMLGRTLGANMFEGNKKITEPNEPWTGVLYGFSFVPDDAFASSPVQVTYVFPQEQKFPTPEVNVPVVSFVDVHGGVRQQDSGRKMFVEFLTSTLVPEPARVSNACGGGCVAN